MEETINQWSDLIAKRQELEAYKLIKDAIEVKNLKSPDLYWRLAQSCRDQAITAGKKDKKVYKSYVEEGLQAAQNGLDIDPNHGKCNSWYGIFLNYLSELEGINARIQNSYKMKEHWQKAIAANPDDYVTEHALGRWCFEVTDLPTIKRQLAKTFFGTPPSSTYEEGLNYLLDCEKKAPGKLVMNALYLAKTYHRLKDYTKAKEYCNQVLSFSETDMETEAAKEEAAHLMKKL